MKIDHINIHPGGYSDYRSEYRNGLTDLGIMYNWIITKRYIAKMGYNFTLGIL